MSNLVEQLICLGFKPHSPVSPGDFICQDDGDGLYIKEWLAAAPQPTQDQIAAAAPPVPPGPSTTDVDLERDRRIALGFTFNGAVFQSRPDDISNINGAGSLAIAAVMTGAQAGNLRWADATNDFLWIAQDNSLVPMDAQTVIAFGQAAAAWKSQHIFAARALKDAPIPTNYRDAVFWP